MKKAVLRNFTKFTGKHCRPEACNFIKKDTLAQVFSSEFCEISKNTFFIKHLWTTAYIYFDITKSLFRIQQYYITLFYQEVKYISKFF